MNYNSEWKDGKTAPKDGRYILIIDDLHNMMVVCWRSDECVWATVETLDQEFDPIIPVLWCEPNWPDGVKVNRTIDDD